MLLVSEIVLRDIAATIAEMTQVLESFDARLAAIEGARAGTLCVECDREWVDGLERWRAEDVDDEIVFYCPHCWEEEFGDG